MMMRPERLDHGLFAPLVLMQETRLHEASLWQSS